MQNNMINYIFTGTEYRRVARISFRRKDIKGVDKWMWEGVSPAQKVLKNLPLNAIYWCIFTRCWTKFKSHALYTGV